MTTHDDRWSSEPPWYRYGPAMIDALRSARLSNGYTAAVLVDAAGTEYLTLVNPAGVGRTAMFDPACATVYHEQLGPLDAETAKRIAE
jgi:hypothetical protein